MNALYIAYKNVNRNSRVAKTCMLFLACIAISFKVYAGNIVGVTGANAALNGVNQGPIAYGQTGLVLFGVKMEAQGAYGPITQINISSTVNTNGYFTDGKLYRSADGVFSAGDVQVGTVSFNGPMVNVTGLSESFSNGQIKYFFLVADYTLNTGTAPGNIQFKFVSGQSPAAISGGGTINDLNINGVNYAIAQSSVTAAGFNALANGVNQGPLYLGQTGLALFGFSLTATGTFNMNELHISSTGSGNNGYFTNGKIYRSTDNVYSAGDVLVGTAAFNGADVAVTGLSEIIANGTTKYYFLVADYSVSWGSLPSTVQFQFANGQAQSAVKQASPFISVNNLSAAGVNYSLPLPSVAIAGANAAVNGVSQGPLYYGQTNIALFGFALTATGPVTVNEFHLQSTAAGYFGNGKMYRSTDNVYSPATDVQVGSVSFSGTDVNVTGLTESFNEPSGKTYYYFLVGDFSNSNGTVPGNVQFKFVSGQPTAAVIQSSPNRTFNTYTVSGVNYSLPSPVSMISANAAANGITQGAISYGQNNIVLFGFGLSVFGTYNVKEFHITNPGNTNNGYFGNGRLYRSTDNVYSADDALISATVNFSGSEVAITNINEAFSNVNGTTYYYFLKGDFSVSSGTRPSTIQFRFVSAQTQPAVVQTTPYTYKAYNNFDINGSVFTIAVNNTVSMTSANSASNGITPSPLTYGQTNIVLFGFGTTVTGTIAFNEFHITNPGNGNNNGYFANGRLYRSTDNVYSVNDVQVGTVAFNGAEVAITGLSEQFTNASNSTLYYFLVADYTQAWGSAATPIQFQFVSGQSPAAIIQSAGQYTTFNTFDISGTVYSFSRISVWKGGTDPNWNNPLNWTGNFVPGANDVAQIGTEIFVNQPIISGNYSVSSITLGTVQAVTLTVNNGYTLTVAGDILQKRSSGSNVANIITGAGSLIASSLIIGDGTTALTAQSTKITSSIASISLNSSVAIRSATNNNATLDVTSGTIAIKEALQTINAVAANNSTFSCAASAILNMMGAAPFNLSAIGTNTINLPGVVDYNGTTAQAIKAGTYSTLKINNATGITLTSAVTVNKLVLGDSQANTVFDENGAGLTIGAGGHIEMYNGAKMIWRSSSFTLRADDVIGSCTTLEFNSTAAQNISVISAKNYQNVILNGAGSKNVSSSSIIPFTVDCSYTVNTPVVYNSNVSAIIIKKDFLGSSSINSGTKNISISGDWLNTFSGTIAGLVSYDGANAQLVGGVNYSNVEFKNGNTKTVNATATVIGNLKVWNNTILNANDKLTMLSTATTESNINKLETGADIVGNVTVQSYITNSRSYRTMSSPINDNAIFSGKKTFAQLQNYMFITGPGGSANGFDLGGAASPYAVTLQKYNEPATASQSSYIPVSNINEAIAPGKAFYLYFRGDRIHNTYNKVNAPYAVPESVTAEYKGPINKGTITVPLSYTNNVGDAYNGFNLVGNPYPSAIDWSALTKLNVPNKFYIIKPDGSSSTYSNGISSNSGGKDIKYISPGQAFYVQVSTPGASLVFTESSKASVSAQARFLSTPGSDLIAVGKKMTSNATVLGGTGLPAQLKINLQNSQDTDETIVVMQNGYKLATEDEDALYYAGSTVSLSTLSSDNKSMAINFLPDVSQVGEVKLNVNATATGPVNLNFTDLSAAANYQAILTDLYLNKIVDVKANPVYAFTIDKSISATFGSNRFKLSFIPPQTLPVELTAFSVKKNNVGAKLTWTTASEKNNDHFEVERSADGKSFATIGRVDGIGNSTVTVNYSYIDSSPINGVNYFRLRQVDKDGKFTYSDIISLNYSIATSENGIELVLYPNPAIEEIRINLKNQNYSVNLTIFDLEGRKVLSSTYVAGQNVSQNVIDLKKGLYIVELQNEKTSKIVGKAKFLKD